MLDPSENIESKKVPGSPRKDSVKAMLNEANRYIRNEKIWLKDEVKRVELAYAVIKDEEMKISS